MDSTRNLQKLHKDNLLIHNDKFNKDIFNGKNKKQKNKKANSVMKRRMPYINKGFDAYY